MNIDFILGERKYLQFEVKSLISQKVVIVSSVYRLSNSSGEVVDSGDCEIIDGNMLQVLLMPETVGDYILEIEYEIPPELRKVRCNIHVY